MNVDGRTWPTKFKKYLREQIGKEDHENAWSRSHKLQGVRTRRQQECVDIAWAIATARSAEMSPERREALQSNMVIDLSQCVTRAPFSTQVRLR